MKISASGIMIFAALMGFAMGAPKSGDRVLSEHFDTAKEQLKWQERWPNADFASWLPGYEGSPSLCITVPPGQTDEKMNHLPFDITPFRGCLLLFECMAKAENVTQPEAAHLGVKLMLHYRSKSHGPFWQNENDVHGTFDWKKLSFQTRIAPDAAEGEIHLGLQGSSGTAWFDHIRVTVLKGQLPERPAQYWQLRRRIGFQPVLVSGLPACRSNQEALAGDPSEPLLPRKLAGQRNLRRKLTT